MTVVSETARSPLIPPYTELELTCILDGYDAKVECIESLRGWHLGVLQHALAQAEKLAFKYSTEFRTRSCNSFGGGLWLEATHCFRELLLTHSPLFLEGILTNETSAAEYAEPTSTLLSATRD